MCLVCYVEEQRSQLCVPPLQSPAWQACSSAGAAASPATGVQGTGGRRQGGWGRRVLVGGAGGCWWAGQAGVLVGVRVDLCVCWL